MKLLRIVRLLFVFAIAAAAGAALLFPAIDSTPAYPQRIVLTLTADPAHSQAVTWQLSTPISHPQAQISAAAADPAFTKSALTVSAEHTGSDSYAAMFKDLKADTLYSYRVGGDSSWSEWNNFHTASDKPAPFSFLYFGDAQNDISSMWSRVVRAAVLNAPGARFMVHAGDLVAEGYDEHLWDEWTRALGFVTAMIPCLPVTGNHDLHHPPAEGKAILSAEPPWNATFSLPANGPDAPEQRGLSYSIDYQGVRFIALDVNVWANTDFVASERERIAKSELSWLEHELNANPNRWTIVVQHQTMYSVGKERDYKEMRDALLPLYDKYGVDLVLQGHDHQYARTFKLAANKVVSETAKGTVYVISVSGPKMYEHDNRFDTLMAKTIQNRQMYQVIDVKPEQIMFHAYAATGELLDDFTLRKANSVGR